MVVVGREGSNDDSIMEGVLRLGANRCLCVVVVVGGGGGGAAL